MLITPEMVSRNDGGEVLAKIAKRAVQEFTDVSGLAPEALTGAKRDGDGWSLIVDVVEYQRIPSTMSVLASYRIDTDAQGALVSYERLRRFNRITTD
jgi:hypothetical protein